MKRSLESNRQKENPRKKPRLQSRKKQPGFDEEIFSETTYSIRNGLRYVKPYYFTFTTHAKGRWVGSTVYDVFSREFQAEVPEFYEKAIKAGKVTVNGTVATMETVINHNDLVCHRVHRHEPPVAAEPLRILHEDDCLVVLDKPSSIPVHPCGRYRHNSVVFLLGKEHNLRNLHTIHRLDRLTSGLLMFAKSLATAQKLEIQIRQRQVTKEYVCRVQGEFPSEPLECNEPILIVSNKLGVCHVDPSGKPCSTTFSRLSYNGKSSVVKCSPKTGRMHQIRVHLQWLGYPILNDPLYNHPAWGPGRGRQGEESIDMEQVILDIVKTTYTEATIAQRDQRNIGSVSVSSLPLNREGDSGGDASENPYGSELVSKVRGTSSVPVSSLPLNREGDSGGDAPYGSELVSKVTDTCSLTTHSQGLTSDSSGSDSNIAIKQEYEVATSSVEACIETEELRTTDSLGCNSKCLPKRQLANTLTEGEMKAESVTSQQDPDSGPHSAASTIKHEEGSGSTIHEGGIGHSEEREAQDEDPDCTECRIIRPDPTPKELVMYLHALSYKGPDWEFATEIPVWASPDWQEN